MDRYAYVKKCTDVNRWPDLNEKAQQLCSLIEGRILLREELQVRLAANQLMLGEKELTRLLNLLRQNGRAVLLPGVGRTSELDNHYAVDRFSRGRLRCNRCGQTGALYRVDCPDCGQECYQCEECLPLGASRSCSELWAFPVLEELPVSIDHVAKGSPAQHGNPLLVGREQLKAKLDFALTQAQRDAARHVLQEMAEPGPSLINVTVACGGGKTEVVFAAIAYMLRQGGRVLFAIPRREVVRDLQPRLAKAFPGVPLLTLYGGSAERYAAGDLVLATTHQVLRFYRCFDLVILDEVDAFPYRDSAMLQFGMERARKPEGKLILMTATPEGHGLTGNLQVTIPARHHGYPLPVPELLKVQQLKLSPDSRPFLPPLVLELIFGSVLQSDSCLLVFVPSVALTSVVAEYLRKVLLVQEERKKPGCAEQYFRCWGAHPHLGIAGVHAGDTQSEAKVKAFRAGKLAILVTTSILERGVTFPNCQALVLLADSEQIFNPGTLIQIAGRVGRTTVYPSGQVWFIGSKISTAMKSAVKSIEALNNEAARKGYLK